VRHRRLGAFGLTVIAARQPRGSSGSASQTAHGSQHVLYLPRLPAASVRMAMQPRSPRCPWRRSRKRVPCCSASTAPAAT